MLCQRKTARAGLTIIECLLALTMLGVLTTLVAQLTYWSKTQKVRDHRRMLAIEHVQNVLETARSLPSADLSAEWAKKQTLPTWVAEQLPDPKQTLEVSEMPNEPRLKRVSITVSWHHQAGRPDKPVSLVTVVGPRDLANKQADSSTEAPKP